MKITHYLLLAFAMVTLSGCGSGFGIMAVTGAVYASKPDELPPADLATAAAPHETWCYKTLGTVDCYAQPQTNQAGRLINVDPENRFPMTTQAYNKAAQPSP